MKVQTFLFFLKWSCKTHFHLSFKHKSLRDVIKLFCNVCQLSITHHTIKKGPVLTSNPIYGPRGKWTCPHSAPHAVDQCMGRLKSFLVNSARHSWGHVLAVYDPIFSYPSSFIRVSRILQNRRLTEWVQINNQISITIIVVIWSGEKQLNIIRST